MTTSAEESILKLIARYRVVTRGVVAVTAGSEAKGDKLLARLAKAGLVTTIRGLPGNRSIYQLSRKGAGSIGAVDSRARLHGTQAVLKHLGVLLFCYGEAKAFRLEDDELAVVAPDGLPPGVYCIAKVKELACVYHCYVPSPTTSVETATRRLAHMLADLVATPANKQLVSDGRVGLVVLVSSVARRRTLMDAVRRSERGKRPLVKSIRVRIEAIPELGKYFGGGPPESAAAPQPLLWEETTSPHENE
jgi:hypothetical protein